jgi:hypothetical protein
MFTHAFFVQKFVQSQTLSTEKLLNSLSYEKCECKMLMKLTPGVDFTNILCAAFTSKDPNEQKRLTA